MNNAIFNAGDILETIRMIQDECLDIRTTTMGISLLDCIDSDILGTSGLVGQIKGYLYGNYILSASTWIYLCKYPVWHPLWSNDTGYR